MALIVAGIVGMDARVAPMIPVFHAVATVPAGAVYARAHVLRVDGIRNLPTHLQTARHHPVQEPHR